MKKIYLILFALMSVLGMNAQTEYSWNFTSIPAADITAMEADNTNWHYHSAKFRYNYLPALDNAALTANGTELQYTAGLKFTATAAAASSSTAANENGRVRPTNESGKVNLNLNGTGIKVTTPSVKKGQVLTVVFASSSSSTARTFTPTNLTDLDNFGTTTGKVTATATVEADGVVTLETTGGLYVYSLSVKNASMEDVIKNNTLRNPNNNQVIMTKRDASKYYYNTADLASIDFDHNTSYVKVNTNAGSIDTYKGTVSGIEFLKKEEQGTPGDITNNGVEITEAKGWLESAYIKWNLLEGATSYAVYVKGGQYSDYTKLDNQLVRNYGTYGRADAVGLKAGTNYAFKVVPIINNAEDASKASTAENMEVKNYSRQGFAFMGGYTPGAYKSDGTLKDGAKVIYITKNTAKTVSTNVAGAETNPCVGWQTILDAYEKGQEKTPIAFRIIGLVEKEDLDHISSSVMGLQIKGKNAYDEVNITIEGIGDDATLRGFGFNVRNVKGLEFRNFGSMRFPEDGISLDTDNSNVWIHHIDFFYGKKGSGDKEKGDGAADLKDDSKYITVSYNRYWDSGKSCLWGMKSESGPNYANLDHNWFDHSDSRHPRVRTMTVHVWNNYYDNVAKFGVGAATGSSIFVENNYFLKTKKPILSSLQGTDGLGSGTFSGENGGMIKAYGNYFDRNAVNFSYYTQNNPSSKGYDAYETSTRDEKVPSTEKTLAGGTTYNNFDTDKSLMYEYTPLDAAEVPADVTGFYGAGRMNHGDFTYTFADNVGNDDTDSAYDETYSSKIDAYKAKVVSIFGGEDMGGTGGEGGGEGGGETPTPTPEGTITATFDGAPSQSMFTVDGDYGDGKITYNGTYLKKGVKLNSAGSITFTPAKNYNMTIVLATSKAATDVTLNGTKTTVSGTTNTDGAYYQLAPIAITSGTKYTISKGSKESLVMMVILEPTE